MKLYVCPSTQSLGPASGSKADPAGFDATIDLITVFGNLLVAFRSSRGPCVPGAEVTGPHAHFSYFSVLWLSNSHFPPPAPAAQPRRQ